MDKEVKRLWWGDEATPEPDSLFYGPRTLFVETTDGQVWSFENAQIASFQTEAPVGEALCVEPLDGLVDRVLPFPVGDTKKDGER